MIIGLIHEWSLHIHIIGFSIVGNVVFWIRRRRVGLIVVFNVLIFRFPTAKGIVLRISTIIRLWLAISIVILTGFSKVWKFNILFPWVRYVTCSRVPDMLDMCMWLILILKEFGWRNPDLWNKPLILPAPPMVQELKGFTNSDLRWILPLKAFRGAVCFNKGWWVLCQCTPWNRCLLLASCKAWEIY